MAEKPSSNTMEINSILEEARRRNSAASTAEKPAARSGAKKTVTSAGKPVDTDYVDISSGVYPQAERTQKPQTKQKSKKPIVITIVVILVLALAGVGGFTWFRYQNSGSSKIVSDNVFVNGVDLGGKTIDEARKALAGIEQDLAEAIKVHVQADDKEFNLTKDDFVYSFNTNEILDQIIRHSEEKSLAKEKKEFEIAMKVDTAKTKEVVEGIAKEVYSKPINARVVKFDSSADDMFTFRKEADGKSIDNDDLVNKINGVFQGGKVAGNVVAAVTSVAPKVTEKYLRDNIVLLSSYSTISTNNSNGNENMRVSMNACDSSIIEPGETWSFNDCTGNSNLESNGYLPAGVIVQGRSETGVGGGICQSSSTIYNAGLLCGMSVVERACHYYKSTYVDAGRDATIDYGNIDLKLENPFKYQLFMKCWMDGVELTCEIYGLQNSKFDEVEISTSDPDYFSTGYTVRAWRTYYKDGKKVDEDELPKSTYYTVAPGGSSDSDSGSSSYEADDDDDDSSSSGESSDSGESGNEGNTPDAGSTPVDGGESGNADGGNAEGGEAETPPDA